MKREKKERDNSVLRLVTMELLPQLLERVAACDGLSGALEFQVIAPSSSSVSFVVHDHFPQSFINLKSEFTYFSPSYSNFFPQLRIDQTGCKRPLVLGSLTTLSPEILFVNLLEVHKAFQRKGIGSSFQQTLITSAGKYGYRFAGASHENLEALQFFLQQGWYHFIEVREECKPVVQKILGTVDLEERGSTHFSIGFLHSQDREAFIQDAALQQSVEERMERFSLGRSSGQVAHTR